MTMSLNLLTRAIALTLATAALAACGGDGGSPNRTGTLNLGITDGPIESAEAVVVEFTGVELKPKGGPAFSIDFTTPKQINLMDYQGEERAVLLDGETIDAGDYEWMRLKVNVDPNVSDDSYVMMGGAECEMRIPSGAESGLKLIRGFTVWPGSVTNFTIDFDLLKSVLQPPGQHSLDPTVCDGEAYLLKPVLRLVDNDEIGSITGFVSPDLVAQECSSTGYGKVYLFGPYITDAPDPDDIDDNDADGLDPLTTALVDLDGQSNYAYTIGYAPPGNYVAAYTCDVDMPDIDADVADSPAGADEVVNFTPSTVDPVTVVAGQATTEVNF